MKRTLFISIFITAAISIFALTTWEGDSSQFWNDSDNWDTGIIPDNLTDVYITAGTPNDPRIAITDSECRNITIESGVLFMIYDEDLTVIGDMTIHGELEMTQNLAKLYVNGDIDWESGSTANIVDNSAEIWIKSIWRFNPGSNVHLDRGYVEFDGDTNGFITCKSSNSYFNHLRSDKEGWAAVIISAQSTEDLIINGNFYHYEDSKIQSLTEHNIILKGSFNNFNVSGEGIDLDYGTFIFDGATHNITLYAYDHFNNLVISSSGNTTLNSELRTSGDILIESGTLVTNNHTIRLGGNWTNTVGEAAFDEGTGRVIIWGAYDPQFCNSDETFYELELDKVFGENFYIDGYDVTCAAYDWTIGAIEVLSGSFTANSLVDSGIYGSYYLYSGGTIYLNNSGSWVDLNGEIHIYGGTMIVAGSISEWPYSSDAVIEMSDGVLDFTECGIDINTSHVLTSDITGGTIRTVGDFICSRTDWNPTGGTLELYGLDDADLSMDVGSNFYDVRINKAATEVITSKITESEYNDIGFTSPDKRRTIHKDKESNRNEIDKGGNVIELTRSNQVIVASQLVINGDLYIDSGTFYNADFGIDVRDDLFCYGNLFIAGFLYIGDDCHYYSGSNVDLHGNIENGTYTGRHGSAIHYSGSTFNQISGYYFVESIHLNNGCQYNGYDSYVGEVHVYVNGHSLDNVIQIDDSDSYFGEFYIDTGANASLYDCAYDLETFHTFISAPLDINEFSLNTTYMEINDMGELIIDDGGVVDISSNGPFIHSGGTLTMVAGSTLDSGFNISYSTGSIENITGGEIYLEGSFIDEDNIFNPSDGTVTFDGSSTSNIFGPTVFHNLNINKTASTVTTADAMNINGDFTINSGIFDTNGFDMNVGGDWANNVGDAGFIEGTQTVTLDNTEDVSINNNETFYTLIINKSTYSVTSTNAMDINGDFVITSGTFDLNGNTVNTNDVDVNNGGILIVDEGASLQVNGGNNLNVYSGGAIEVIGSSSNLATVTRRGVSGNYGFNVYSSGTISAEYGLFENMADGGVYVRDGAYVDPTYSFNYCTFQNGYVGSGTLLYLNNDEEITITGANFPDHASSEFNVAKVENQGRITMVNYTGIFSGEAHDYDDFIPERIIWELPEIADLTITYNVGTDEIELSWTYPVPVDHFNVYRSTDPYDFSSATVFTTTSIDYSEPAPGTQYFYRVTAENVTDNISSGSN